jgi:glycosyltransferase involved in cell wall biosynthesis
MKILYLGNRLMKHGVNPTSVETLGERFKEFAQVMQYSDKKNSFLRMFDMWKAVWGNRKNTNYVVIDTYSTSAFHYAWTSGFLCQLLNLPYVLILRGGNLEIRFKKSKKLSKRLIFNAQEIVAPSGYLQDVTYQLFDRRPKVIPNFIDIENYHFPKRSLKQEVALLWVRAFDKIYNPELAVEVLHLLRKNGVQAKLTFVGPDKDGTMEVCKKLAKELQLDPYIVFTGRLTKFEWTSLAKNHHIFINTTNIDNTPVSVMEAMALGMPVVTTKVGGIPYLFEDQVEGVMVAPDDAMAMYEAIQLLFSNPDQYSFISNGARKKAELWDWKVIKNQWIEVFSTLN